jgi:hypothetical protein
MVLVKTGGVMLWNTTFSHIIFNKTWLYLVIGIDGLYELFW